MKALGGISGSTPREVPGRVFRTTIGVTYLEIPEAATRGNSEETFRGNFWFSPERLVEEFSEKLLKKSPEELLEKPPDSLRGINSRRNARSNPKRYSCMRNSRRNPSSNCR